MLTIKQANELKEQVKHYLIPDPYSWASGDYVITSLYYDSPDLQCYWEKVNGIKFRKKLRIRFYETKEKLTEDSLIFVEVKQRYDKTIQKRRVEMKYKDSLTLCNERIIPEHNEEDTPVIEEILAMVEERNLQPTLITSYFRHAFVGTDYDIGLRITFDSNIRYRINDLDLNSKKPGRFIVSPDRVILEIKANERVPFWLTELIAQNNYRLVRISKYCTGLEVEKEFPRRIEAY
ncbi:TPA: polyphosphate polymerase domain-containing protein [Methanosarcina acetivorans]|uniref:Polyphosphate polymerase domain-containing protein n=1 Tax=Methanosarcina acetivorans TaxID=2214 RepID=A0A832SCI2_9EURY|nr:polyphosphate polymerase domain-containing protein [Methanosarcina acetivorans]HIH94454.1 polyphosphate polymerase domain-containing protein [Methanosarcina acetivorans]